MELNLSSEEAAFRDEVRAFIAKNYPTEMRVPNPETDLSKEQMLLWHRILYQKGWIAPLWPKEHGRQHRPLGAKVLRQPGRRWWARGAAHRARLGR